MPLANHTQALGHALAGAVAGAFALLVIYPADTYKTRRQIEDASFLDIIRREGLMSMYVGLDVGMLYFALNQFVFFFVYWWLKNRIAQLTGKHITEHIKLNLLIGFIAGCVTQVCTLPLNTLHTRLQGFGSSNPCPAPSPSQMIHNIYDENGLSGFWAGLQTALVLSVNPSITFVLFEQMKKKLETRKKPTTPEIFLVGAIAKVLATVLTFPLVLAKTRLQSVTGRAYAGLFDFLLQTVRTDGAAGLFKGMNAKCAQVALTSAVTFAAEDIAARYAFALLLAAGVQQTVGQP